MQIVLGKLEQQGDVLMYPVLTKGVKSKLKKLKNIKVLHKTTTQSNEHRVIRGTLTQFEGDFYLTGKEPVLVTHIEHDPKGETPLVLEPNTLYLKEIVNEQDHITNELRKVID
jgi:hypothetical protein